MKLQSSSWKSRTIHLPGFNNTKFDDSGTCELSITEQQAELLTTQVTGLSIIGEHDKKHHTKEAIIDAKVEPTNQKEIEVNQEALSQDEVNQEAEKQKKAAIKQIGKIKDIKKLKELAADYGKEAEGLKTVLDYRNFLVSKI